MPFRINVAGQVGQIKLAQGKALWPLFETVVNSIQSLEDTDQENKTITIEALRNPFIQYKYNSKAEQEEELSHFEEFIITDNGNGFNDTNYNSFLEAYSQLKVKKGCKGIGRFLWLKAFSTVTISSTYKENGHWYLRTFDFTLGGVFPENNVKKLDGDSYTLCTKIHLKQFKSIYRDVVSLKLESLAKKIIEHCLPYFIMEICPNIILKDDIGESISLNKYYDSTYKDSLHKDTMILRGRTYSLYHMLIAEGLDKHELHLCANNREVKSIELSKFIPNMQKKLSTDIGNCYYVGYLSGDYLDESVNSERAEFDFNDSLLLGDNRDASEDEIICGALELIKQYLHDDLSKINEEKKRQIDRFVQSLKPQYRFLLNNRPDVYDKIQSGLSDEKIDLELYRFQQEWEYETAKQKADIEERIRKDATSDLDFETVFEEYCHIITDLSRAGLAQYVAKRKAVIDLLGKALETDINGKYSKESRIHSIICPMKTTSDEIDFDDMNLWLIDDRLAYHHFLASDKPMAQINPLENDINKRMDIAIFDAALSYTSDTENINSITIVELKRPERDDPDNDPVRQVLHYVDDIKSGKIKKANGRGFGDVSKVAFYCYVVGDLTPSMHDSAKGAGLVLSQDKEGYFGYVPSYGVYAEVISYDKLLKDAKQRNQVFFDKLFNIKTN